MSSTAEMVTDADYADFLQTLRTYQQAAGDLDAEDNRVTFRFMFNTNIAERTDIHTLRELARRMGLNRFGSSKRDVVSIIVNEYIGTARNSTVDKVLAHLDTISEAEKVEQTGDNSVQITFLDGRTATVTVQS